MHPRAAMNHLAKKLAQIAPDKRRSILQDLPNHLAKAANIERLNMLLTNFEFLNAKLAAPNLGVQALIEDYDLALQPTIQLPNEGKNTLRLIQEAIRLSAHVLEKDKQQFAEQLFNRLALDTNPQIQTLLQQAKQSKTAPWLRPVKPSPTAAGTALVRTLEGHTSIIEDCALSDDGRIALSASRDGTLRLWNLENGVCDRVLIVHQQRIKACSLSGNARLALSASEDKTLRLWDVSTGDCLHILAGHQDKVTRCALSQDGSIALSASDDGTLRVWQTETGRCLRVLAGHADRVACCALSSDGTKAVSGSLDCTLRWWDTHTGECLATLDNEQGALIDCALSGDGDFALSVVDVLILEEVPGSPRQLDIRAPSNQEDLGQPLEIKQVDTRDFPVEVKEDLYQMLSSIVETTGLSMEMLGENLRLKFWDLRTGNCIRVFEEPDYPATKCALSADARIALSATMGGGTVRVWDTASGECLSVLASSSTFVSSCALDRKGRFALSTSDNAEIRLWNAQKAIQLGSSEVVVGQGASVGGCGYINNGHQAISMSSGGSIQRWKTLTGECLQTLESEQSPLLLRCSVSSSTNVALVGMARDYFHHLYLIDLTSGETLLKLTGGHTAAISSFAISEEGRLAVSASQGDGTLRLWDLQHKKFLVLEEWSEQGEEILCCDLNGDGRIVLSASSRGILRVQNLREKVCKQIVTGHSGKITTCVLSANGAIAVSTSEDGTLHLWDIVMSRCLQTLSLKDKDVNLKRCTLNKDGRLIAYAPERHTIRIIETYTAGAVGTFTFDSWVSAVAFSPDSRQIMVGDYSGSVHFLQLEAIH